MAGTRALLASIGAGASLIAAAALSLLAVSAVFAFGGWSDPVAKSVRKPALILGGPTPAHPGTGGAGSSGPVITPMSPIVVPAQARRRRPAASKPGDGASRTGRAADRLAPRLPAPGAASAPVPGPPATQDVAPTSPPAVARRKRTGDGVRTAGEGLTAKVQNAGTALAQVTAPLAPPIGAAVQNVLNIVAALVRRSTSGLGGALDALLPPK